MVKIHSAYDVPPSVGLVFDPDDDMTEQNHADECDINLIIERYSRTGVLGDPLAMPSVSAQFGDFSEVPSYQTAMNYLVSAQEAFDSLPAKIRKEFDNDPAKLLDFIGKEENYDEAVRLGLISERSVADAPAASPSTPASTPAATSGGQGEK